MSARSWGIRRSGRAARRSRRVTPRRREDGNDRCAAVTLAAVAGPALWIAAGSLSRLSRVPSHVLARALAQAPAQAPTRGLARGLARGPARVPGVSPGAGPGAGFVAAALSGAVEGRVVRRRTTTDAVLAMCSPPKIRTMRTVSGRCRWAMNGSSALQTINMMSISNRGRRVRNRPVTPALATARYAAPCTVTSDTPCHSRDLRPRAERAGEEQPERPAVVRRDCRGRRACAAKITSAPLGHVPRRRSASDIIHTPSTPSPATNPPWRLAHTAINGGASASHATRPRDARWVQTSKSANARYVNAPAAAAIATPAR